MNKKKDYTISTGNIFTDLGFPDAEERMAKINLALQINVLIKRKKLTQQRAAKLLAIDQPKISALSTGKLSGFSLERLFRFLIILGQDITILRQGFLLRIKLRRTRSYGRPAVLMNG